MSDTTGNAVAAAKAELRRGLVSARSEMTPTQRAAAAHDLAAWMAADLPFRLEADVVVCCYVASGTEPGTALLIDALVDRGVTVLLPVTPPGPPRPLLWGRYRGPQSLRPGRFGLQEPTVGHLSGAALDTATVALIPALAVDRDGARLGRGAGYYDRSLATTGAELVAVVYDDEVLEKVPSDDHDVVVGWSLTPGDGFMRLGSVRSLPFD